MLTRIVWLVWLVKYMVCVGVVEAGERMEDVEENASPLECNQILQEAGFQRLQNPIKIIPR